MFLGWNGLLASLTGELQTYTTFFKWSFVTFISSTAPYLYAAWAGRGTFPKEAWVLFLLILILFLVNLTRKICRHQKKDKIHS